MFQRGIVKHSSLVTAVATNLVSSGIYDAMMRATQSESASRAIQGLANRITKKFRQPTNTHATPHNHGAELTAVHSQLYTSTWKVGNETLSIEHYVLFNRYTSDEHNTAQCTHLVKELFAVRGNKSPWSVLEDMLEHCDYYAGRHLESMVGAVPRDKHSVTPFLIGGESRPRLRAVKGAKGQLRFQIEVPGMSKKNLLKGPKRKPLTDCRAKKKDDRRAKSWVHIELKEDQGHQRLCLKGYRKMGSSGYDFSDEVKWIGSAARQTPLFGFDWDASTVTIAGGIIDVVLKPRQRRQSRNKQSNKQRLR